MFVWKAQPGFRETSKMQLSLEALGRLYKPHNTMDSLLQDAAEIAAELLKFEICGVAWLNQNNSNIQLRASYSQNGANNDSNRVNRLISSIVQKKENIDGSSDSCNGQFDNGMNNKELVEPLRVNEEVVGYLYAIDGKGAIARVSRRARGLFVVLSQHISFAIRMHEMQLKSANHYASVRSFRNDENALQRSTLDSNILEAAKEPDKGAQIIARSFYKELRKAGFTTKQILVVATEIIGSLNETLRKTKAKAANAEKSV